MSKTTNTLEEKEFELRSDYIEGEDLAIWNVDNEHFNTIQKNLTGMGIKLLVGPRGVGKTHQMLIAYEECKQDPKKPLAIYVTFNKYYRLEPLLTKSSNAIQVFHVWVLCNIMLACSELLQQLQSDIDLFDGQSNLNTDMLQKFVSDAERGIIETDSDELQHEISISQVIFLTENLLERLKRKRAVLLFDDAALTLTPDYMIEFFDILRNLKTKKIVPKASVYPGTTEYGPRFHVGHDGEEIQCWLGVEDSTYSTFMDSLIEKRFASYTQNINSDILELLKYASFGIPRAFIGLLRSYNAAKGTLQKKFNEVVESHCNLIKKEYLSLSQKLPQYKGIIEIGFIFFEKAIDDLSIENTRLQNEKNMIIGIEKESLNKRIYERMVLFLKEAGLIYVYSNIKHGPNREYLRYGPHLLFLLKNRAFSGKSRGFNPGEIVDKIKAKSTKHPLRRTIETLLSDIELNNLKLDLPSCQNCNAERLTEEQKFCHVCGTELIAKSNFERCLEIPVEELPITEWQKQKVKEENLKTVGDFIALRDPTAQLRKIKYIGKVKSERIMTEVEKTIDEFLT